jgi:hypothetical protein
MRNTRKIRIPLDNPQCEALDLRITDLFATGRLTEIEKGWLLKARRRLRGIERTIGRITADGRPLPKTDKRPLFYEFVGMDGTDGEIRENYSGWLSRVDEYFERLELKYSLRSFT